MNDFNYDYNLLKSTRLNKKISLLSIAHDLCLSERQIQSIENDSLASFPSVSIKFVAVKKYIRALNLEYIEVIKDYEKVSECFTPQKEFIFNPINLPVRNDNEENQSFLDEIKQEFKLLPKEKKIQYIRNSFIWCLFIFILYECFFNEDINLTIRGYYLQIINFINDIPDILRKIPKLLMKYGN